jgi:hypothetical protein
MGNVFYTAFLMGGLGNQMFQISKAICESRKYNIDVKFRKFSSIGMEGRQPTSYFNNILRNIPFTDDVIIAERIYEPSWDYNTIDISNVNDNIEFWGYYQSSKNFNGYDEYIKSLFSLTEDFTEKIKKKYPNVFNINSVSIHVRRGDYLNISNVLPVIDKSYIDKSLELIPEKSHIFIFSNDKNWVRENLNYDNVTIVDDLEDYEELWMISLCNHNIISNSSFSWWGAFLNKHKDKKVLCPSVWFGPDGEKKWDDIYESDWIKIPVEFSDGKLIYLG